VEFVVRSVPGYLGPYRLLNVVHTGHASQIWQAYDDAQSRVVGVKTLLNLAETDRDEVRFLRQEYTVGHGIQHPRIIEMYAFDWDRGQPYLAMEWFAAPNMKQRMQQGMDKIAPLTPKIIEQAAEALAYFNRMGWVHRDIKPDNFLVTDEGEVKLIDFALAKRRRKGLAKWLTGRTRIQQGTKSYMSPEQIRGLPLDERSDLYSFACTLHELLSGKPPFTGTSVNDLLTKHLKTSPPSLEGANPNVTAVFAQLLRRSMAKNASARPESVDDFLREFRTMRVFRTTPKTPE
jgi:serine/threonine protein kinase